MKNLVSYQRPTKSVLLLLPVPVVVMITSLSMWGNMRSMDRALMSVYEDRLQPAVGIVYLSESIHTKRERVESYLAAQTPLQSVENLRGQLRRCDAEMQQTISHFEKTALTKAESQKLLLLKQAITTYNRMEKSILQLAGSADTREAATQLFNRQAAIPFQQVVQSLHQLAGIQSQVGQESVRKFHQEADLFYSQSTLQMVVAFGIGLLLLVLIYPRKKLRHESTPFHLN